MEPDRKLTSSASLLIFNWEIGMGVKEENLGGERYVKIPSNLVQKLDLMRMLSTWSRSDPPVRIKLNV